ncbi:olfactory receptor 6C1-like [Leptosomus discolor]
MENQTPVTEFVLLGVTDDDQLQYVLFATLLVTYILTLTGSILVITITLINHHLQTPRYFFLRNISILEIGFTSTIIPKALTNLAFGKKAISLRGCLTQTFVCSLLGTTEPLLSAVKSFDKYVAICKPLHYVAIMNSQVCRLLVITAWIAVFTLLSSLAITVESYINIITAVLKIHSVAGRLKAFSTCASHLTVLSNTYVSCIFMYLTPIRPTDWTSARWCPS